MKILKKENMLLFKIEQIEDRKKVIAERFYDSMNDLSKLVSTLKSEGIF